LLSLVLCEDVIGVGGMLLEVDVGGRAAGERGWPASGSKGCTGTTVIRRVGPDALARSCACGIGTDRPMERKLPIDW
jgi:hypothetical protein